MSETFPKGPEALQGDGEREAVSAREVLWDGSGPAGPRGSQATGIDGAAQDRGRSSAGRPRLAVYDSAAIFIGPLEQNREHAHHAVQFTLAMEGEVEVSVRGKIVRAPGMVITPNTPHRILKTDKPLGIILMEPVIRGSRVLESPGNGYAVLDGSVREQLAGCLERGDYEAAFAGVERQMGSRELDQRVGYIVRHISKEERCRHQIRYFAGEAGLSESRVSHLFSREVGVSLKHFILWKKLLFAIDSFRTVSDLSTIALDCGFSDLPHLSRTFRRMFGHSLSEVFSTTTKPGSGPPSRGNSSSVQVEFRE